jgi:mercuric ion binding protein
MKQFSYVLLTTLLFLSIQASAEQKEVSLKVEKMDCPSCPFMIKRAIEDIDGVESASVSMESKVAKVSFDNTKASVGDFIAATTELGFPSNEIK